MNVVFISETLCAASFDLLISFHITLVPNEDLVDVLCSVLFNVTDPGTDILEGLFISDIINQQDTHRTTIIRGGNGTETFLASGIPNLEFNTLPVEVNGLDFEIDTNGSNKGGGEGIVGETKEETRLTNTCVKGGGEEVCVGGRCFFVCGGGGGGD